MIVRDWRTLAPVAATQLYEDEGHRWRTYLDWDPVLMWAEVEAARGAGRLPGFVSLASDDGPVRGWTFFLPDDGIAQIGGLVADTPETAAALVAAVVQSDDARACETVAGFVYAHAPGVEAAFAAHGFELDRYRYLARPVDSPAASWTAATDVWRAGDALAAADLLRQAYGSDGRAFAPRGTDVEWRRYVNNLVSFAGCGRFTSASSRVVRGQGALDGVVLTTTIAPGVVHLAQVAVHPRARGRGLGGRLVDDALASAAARGARRATLLVDERGARAAALYAGRGFEPLATFLAVWRPMLPDL